MISPFFSAIATTALVAPLALAGLMLTGCTDDSSTADSATPAAAAVETVTESPLANLLLSAKPESASTISDTKPTVAPGDSVVLKARIGGRAQPFVAERASMVIADYTTIEACDVMHGDSCPKPWDFCCVPKSDLSAASASVQVVDDSGKLLTASLDDLPGIDAGTYVIVQGTVADGSDASNLIVNANGLFIDSVQH